MRYNTRYIDTVTIQVYAVTMVHYYTQCFSLLISVKGINGNELTYSHPCVRVIPILVCDLTVKRKQSHDPVIMLSKYTQCNANDHNCTESEQDPKNDEFSLAIGP